VCGIWKLSLERLVLVGQLAEHWTIYSIPKVSGSIPTVVRLIFQPARCGYTLRVTLKTLYSPEYVTSKYTPKYQDTKFGDISGNQLEIHLVRKTKICEQFEVQKWHYVYDQERSEQSQWDYLTQITRIYSLGNVRFLEWGILARHPIWSEIWYIFLGPVLFQKV
jgi:hypothetical protein